MQIRSAVIGAAFLLLGVPSVAQLDEGREYFSLNTEKTFAPGDKPTVRLWAQGVDTLQFRVYRVKDPVKFFANLPDPHRFGGQPPRPPRELTVLEQFHLWKYRSRTWLRNVVRRQYPAESRRIIRTALAERSQQRVQRGAATATEYADVPVLNKQQLVSVWTQSVPRGNRWDSQTVPVDVKEKGVYLVEATNGNLQAYTIISVTNLAVISKGSPGKISARVVDRSTGAPLKGCQIVVWSEEKQQAQLETNDDGMAEAGITLANPENVLMLATYRDDFAAGALYGWNLRTDRQMSAYIYTDRPVYRPGHTVYFRAILRLRSPEGYRLPPRSAIQLQIQDPEGKPVFRRDVTPSAMGTVHGEFKLPEASALGYHSVELRSGEVYIGSGGFHVEEYLKPEYEVRVTPEKSRVLLGEEASATIDARYYFGEPVANAKVTWVVHRSRYFPPYYADEFDSEDPRFQDDGFGNEQILEQTGTLDAAGKLTVRFRSESAPHDLRYRIEARVTDAANREISGTGFVLGTAGPYFVHIEPEQYVYKPGETAVFRIEARNYDGQAVPNVPFRVELMEQRDGQESSLFQSTSGQTDASGNARAGLAVRAGSLIARVSSTTPEGRTVQDRTWLWVSGGTEWYGARSQRVEIIPSKKSYRGGEVARLLIVTGVPEAWVWVTAERGTIHSSQLVHAKQPAFTIDMPIRAEFAPNFYVTATFVRENQFYQGTKSVRVPPVEQEMKVSIKSSAAQFKPGGSGTFMIEATDHQGRPVAAEFSLGVVDEAIYAIRREAAQDILSFFYGRAYNQVSTDSSLNYFFYGEAGKRRMQLARIRQSAARAQLKPQQFVEPEIRKLFPDTIRWIADLRTNSNGRAEAKVEYPDSLTTWRATARGITADTKVGSAIERTIVRKNLILRLAVPRFFTEGDEVTIRAIVQNYLEEQKTVRISLDVKGIEMIEGATRDMTVPSRGEVQADFRVRAKAPGKAVLLGKALTDEESDALELTLPVNPFGVELSESKSGTLSSATGQSEADLTFPVTSNPAARGIEISVSPSVAGTIFGALEYLTSYPYGCTEQTMSSFLPNVLVSRAASELGLRSSIDADELAKKVRAGLERLYDYQHEDGGWGWWKSDDSEAFMTAYVLSGLARAQAAGYSVRPDTINRAAQWLRTNPAALRGVSEDLRSYVAYALAEAGTPDKTLLDAVWSNRNSLSPYGLALLGLGLRRAQDGRSEIVADTLEQTARTTDAEAWWEMERDPLLGIAMNSTVEATAFAVKFLTEQRPKSSLLSRAAIYLVNHRNQGYYWSSTKQTAMVVYGLTDYLKLSGELKPDFTATVLVNEKPVLTKRFTAAEALSPGAEPLRIASDQLNPGLNRVRVSKQGTGTLYWSARAVYYMPEAPASTSSSSLRIAREYHRLVPEKTGDRIVYRLEPLTGSVAPGDVIAVRLTVTGHEWKYLMMEDPIPAGTEFIERDELYELSEKPGWWGRWYARREFHDDHAALFQTYFPEGQAEHVYLLKVVSPGQFRVSPARVQPMYEPQHSAATPSRTLEVK
ncbi:MAG TPA: MG2 domain-containing protein [Bryobacteraceae bacterium]|nr:MG2 domain-containing protein [Bryobacteraceae bacterium]